MWGNSADVATGGPQPGQDGSGRPPPAGLIGELGWCWPALGLGATVVMALTGSPLVTAAHGKASAWWFGLSLDGRGGDEALFYLAMVALSVAWLGVGYRLRRRPGTSPPMLWTLALVWAIPLVVGPSLFSGDAYSYAAQGTLTHVGLDPYTYGPNVLEAFGLHHLVMAVSPVWRTTVAPYGPLFLILAGSVMGGVGSHLVAAIVGLRLLEMVGVVCIAWFLPRLARQLGADPVRALWLGLLSPVVLLSFVAAGHNDALMVGLMVAGVTLALEGRPLLGILLCSLAATIKVPALAGVAFVGLMWVRLHPAWVDRLRVVLRAALVSIGIFVTLSLATGLGWGWLSAATWSTPGDVVIAVTPTAALGTVAASLARDLGVSVSNAAVIAILRGVGLAVSAVVGAVLVVRVRRDNLVPSLAVTLLVVVLAGPVLWPWYLTWSFVLLAALPAGQRSRGLVAALAAFGFVVSPVGASVVPSRWSLLVAVALVLMAAAAWRAHRRRPLRAAAMGESLILSWPLPHIPLTPAGHDEPPQTRTNHLSSGRLGWLSEGTALARRRKDDLRP